MSLGGWWGTPPAVTELRDPAVFGAPKAEANSGTWMQVAATERQPCGAGGRRAHRMGREKGSPASDKRPSLAPPETGTEKTLALAPPQTATRPQSIEDPTVGVQDGGAAAAAPSMVCALGGGLGGGCVARRG